MKPYEILEHTADAKFRAYGKTMEEAFGNAAKAMTALVVAPQELDTARELDIEVRAFDSKRLLFEFLDQLLFLMDTEKFLAAEPKELSISHHHGEYVLKAVMRGDDVRKHGGNLKAVTYSEMLVEERSDGTWLVQAVIDI
jgi:SHS2 domain-containing protein